MKASQKKRKKQLKPLFNHQNNYEGATNAFKEFVKLMDKKHGVTSAINLTTLPDGRKKIELIDVDNSEVLESLEEGIIKVDGSEKKEYDKNFDAISAGLFARIVGDFKGKHISDSKIVKKGYRINMCEAFIKAYQITEEEYKQVEEGELKIEVIEEDTKNEYVKLKPVIAEQIVTQLPEMKGMSVLDDCVERVINDTFNSEEQFTVI